MILYNNEIMADTSNKKNIREESLRDLSDFLTAQGEKAFRAKQIWQWIWQRGVTDFAEMSNLSKATRELLSRHYFFDSLFPQQVQTASDGTEKTAWRLTDGEIVESVLIPGNQKFTVCVSSQVGCQLGCKFCATGTLGFKRNLTAGENYEFSLGLNGLGLCATQYASEYMEAEIHTDGYKYTLHFEKGENIGGLKKEKYDKKDTGTRIKWKPDLDVFTDINIPIEYFQETIKRQAIVNDGVKFILKNQTSASKFETFEYCYNDGIMDYVKEIAGDTAFTTPQYWECERKGKDREDLPEYKLKIKSAICFSLKNQLKEYYHNSSFLEHGGAPEKAFRSAFVNQINAYLKANNKYSKNDGQINIQDVEDCIIFVVSSFSTQTSYENQTKKAITNKFIQEAMTDFFRKQLEVYFIENKMDADKISNQVLINMRARIKAENTRKTLKTSLQSKMDMTNRIQKFVDCRSKDVNEREVFIVEGDSALGACKQARDASFQAIMPVRGKILNCLKSDYDKIFKSEIITDLIKVLGCGVEVKSKAAKDLSLFDINNLRWSKILICTDADVDGFHIRTLILTMIYRLMPKIIEAGKVYIAESPLYEVTCKDQTYFAYNEKEMDEIKEEIGDQKYTVQRSKGLGENEAEMMALTTMNPKTRRLIKVTPDDAQKTSEMFDLLLGDNLEGRKEYISDYGHLYLDAADVS